MGYVLVLESKENDRVSFKVSMPPAGSSSDQEEEVDDPLSALEKQIELHQYKSKADGVYYSTSEPKLPNFQTQKPKPKLAKDSQLIPLQSSKDIPYVPHE